MNIFCLTLLVNFCISRIYSTPAIVWNKFSIDSSSPTTYSSEPIDLTTLVSANTAFSSVKESEDLIYSTVIFVLDRKGDGTDGLSRLLYQGPEKIPNIAAKYEQAHSIHAHVSGVKGHVSVTNEVQQVTHYPERVKAVSINEFERKLTKWNDKTLATILIVKVPNRVPRDEIDVIVNSAIDHSNIHSVILLGVRSLDEVRYEKTRFSNKVPRRRHLEDQGNNNQDNNDDYYTPSGIYYVMMTPNIMAGILFMLFFTFATNIGIMNLNMISATDVYVKKYYSIGKEA